MPSSGVAASTQRIGQPYYSPLSISTLNTCSGRLFHPALLSRTGNVLVRFPFPPPLRINGGVPKMIKTIERPLVLILEGLRKLAKLSPKVSAYVYDLINRQVFADLAWHERILADRVRVEAYRRGIQGAVKPGDVVIDLGTGT